MPDQRRCCRAAGKAKMNLIQGMFWVMYVINSTKYFKNFSDNILFC